MNKSGLASRGAFNLQRLALEGNQLSPSAYPVSPTVIVTPKTTTTATVTNTQKNKKFLFSDEVVQKIEDDR